MTLYKPAPPHNHLLGPAVCLCEGCSCEIQSRRCEATDPEYGNQCGDYRGHRGEHMRIVATVFAIAAERAETIK